MDKQYNSYNFEASFKNYLLAENISSVTLKNYLSDIRHYLGFIQQSQIKIGATNVLTIESVNGYFSYLSNLALPQSTVNRRLSTIRKFGSFCISQGWMSENPAKHMNNLKIAEVSTQEMISDFDKTHTSLEIDHVREFLTVINS